MSATPETSRLALRDSGRPVTGAALAWFGAILYPLALNAAALSGQNTSVALQIAVPGGLAFLPFALLRRRPTPALLLMLLGSANVVALIHSAPIGYLQILVLDLAVGYIAAIWSWRVSVTAAVLTVLAQIGSATFYSNGSPNFIDTCVFIVLGVITSWTIGNSARVRRDHAEAVRTQAAAQAITDERLRIARELHDMVAHSIGIIAIQAGVGARVINTQPAEARNALDTIETTSRETLGGLRQALGALRRSAHGQAPLAPAPGLADLDRLAALTLAAGVKVDVRWRGERRAIRSDIELAAYRIVQEALTNVVRHAGTDECEVTIDYQSDFLGVEVVDDGRGRVEAGFGYGIAGMRERVDILGGELTVGPGPGGGFRVAARLPVAAA
jgi:signal transduction histidine kinase